MDPEAIFVRPRNAVWEFLRPGVSYVALLAIGWLILSLLPPAWLWQETDHVLIAGTPVTLWRLAHVLLGAPLYLYAVFHAPRVVETFQAIQIRPDQPAHLLMDGYYGEVRHPFYAMNFMAILGLMFSFASVYPLVIALLGCAVFFWNGYFDERRWLYPQFGAAYAAYAGRVSARYFTRLTGLYVSLLIVLAMLGVLTS